MFHPAFFLLPDKEQLLEIAKANAAAMCAKAGMPIPESLRPKTILQLPLPNPNPTPLPLPLPLPVNLPMGMQGMSNMTMNAAVASMTAATMTAALSGMNALAAMPQLAPLPTITNKPPPSAAPNLNLVNIEEAKKKLAKQANSYSIKELTEVWLFVQNFSVSCYKYSSKNHMDLKYM